MKQFKYVLLLPMVFLLTACPFTTRDDEQVNEQKQVREQLSSMQKSKADADLRYNDLQNDIRVIAGRIDAMEHSQQVNKKNREQEMAELRKQLDAQNEKIKLMQAHVDQADSKLTAALKELSSGGGAASEKAKDDDEPKPKKKGAAASDSTFDEAENLLKEKEFKKALVKYKAYVDKNPKGKQVADATYKMGVCFAELGLKQDAKDFFKDVIDNFPGTPWAKKAKIRLSHLK